MDYAHYEIGTKYDENGEPLFLADGKIVGTVAEVRALLDKFSPPTGWETVRADDPRPGPLCGFGLMKMVPVYDPDRPATIGDIHKALDDFHVRNREALMGGHLEP